MCGGRARVAEIHAGSLEGGWEDLGCGRPFHLGGEEAGAGLWRLGAGCLGGWTSTAVYGDAAGIEGGCVVCLHGCV